VRRFAEVSSYFRGKRVRITTFTEQFTGTTAGLESSGVLRVARDDGRGSDRTDGGFGIRGMRERVAQAGGELHVVTQPGRGFEVTALLPVRGVPV